MDAKVFGSYLKQLRKIKRLTLQNVADISGISQPYLSQIESGYKGVPSSEIIRKLSRTLGVTHIGMMIKAGHITEEEVLTMRRDAGIDDEKQI